MNNNNVECKHLNFEVRGEDRMGFVWCPDCYRVIPMSEAITNLCAEARSVIAEMKKQMH